MSAAGVLPCGLRLILCQMVFHARNVAKSLWIQHLELRFLPTRYSTAFTAQAVTIEAPVFNE